MSDLGLIKGYRFTEVTAPPQMSFHRMFQLALRTWPYLKPMLLHLIILGALGSSGMLVALSPVLWVPIS